VTRGAAHPAVPALATRGTTHPNRLRRVDRWLLAAHGPLLRGSGRPVVVDLGYGRHPVTVLELARRVRGVAPRAEVVGVELDPERVAAARRLAGPASGVRFVRGGFDLGAELGAGLDPGGLAGGRGGVHVLRAFNVLRQYPVADVPPAWDAMRSRLAPGGVLLDGTCDELGRLAAWVAIDREGPVSLVLSWRLAGLDRPGDVAARLPKVLIERNRPPHGVHRFLAELDAAWQRAAPLGVLGARQRLVAACQALREAGWPLRGEREGWWRHGTVEVAWACVAD
jgi:hypothetical protein